MNKCLIAILALSLCLSTTVACFAKDSNKPVYGRASPNYTSVISISAVLNRYGNNAKLAISARERSSLSTITGTFKLVNSAGDVVSTTHGSLRKSGITHTYSHTFSLPKKDSYRVKYTLKTYKNGSLKETIKGTTNTITRD